MCFCCCFTLATQAFGVKSDQDQDGVSWFDTARGLANAALEERQCIVFEIDLQRSVACGDHKLISNLEASTTRNYAASADVVQLYDLAKDPTEQSNVAADTAYAGVLARLQEYLDCHDKDTSKSGATSCDTAALNPLERATTKPATGVTAASTEAATEGSQGTTTTSGAGDATTGGAGNATPGGTTTQAGNFTSPVADGATACAQAGVVLVAAALAVAA